MEKGTTNQTPQIRRQKSVRPIPRDPGSYPCTFRRQVSWLEAHRRVPPSRFPSDWSVSFVVSAPLIQWRDRAGFAPASLLTTVMEWLHAAAPPYLFDFSTAHLSGMARRLYIHSAKVNYTTKLLICKTFIIFLYHCTNNPGWKNMALVMISPVWLENINKKYYRV